MKYILPLLLFCVPAQAEVVREMSNLVTKDNVNGAVALNGVTTIPGGSFSVGGSTFVVTGGKVGIGAAPLFPLYVSADNGTNAIAELRSPNDSVFLTLDTIQTSGDYAQLLYRRNGASGDGWNVGMDNTGNSYKVSSRVSSVNADRLTILADGSVGIGTPSPQDKLDISSGTIRMAGTGSPTVGYALCLAASGAMGHCTDTPAANGACTCTTP